MMYLGIIFLVAIIGISITGIFLVINDGQELSNINISVQEKNTEIAVESLNIHGNRNDGTLKLSNTSNEEIRVIQIRVYDEDGNHVTSFDIDEIVYGNSEIKVDDLPIALQGMIRQ